MSFDPALAPDGFPTRKPSAPDPAREVQEMARLLVGSARTLSAAADAVENGTAARSLAEMAQMRRRAADTVIALAADAGVAVRIDAEDDEEHIVGDAESADDATVIEELLLKDDHLIVRLDAALGVDLPPMVKDQIRLTGAQLRDGFARWPAGSDVAPVRDNPRFLLRAHG